MIPGGAVVKKDLKYYLVCWIVLVVLYNVICFVTPSEINGISKYSGAFWSGYLFIMATFILHLVYAIFALSSNSKEKKILNVPIMVISCFEITVMVVCGTICMTLPNLPNWVAVVVCSIILAFSVISLITVKTVGDNVSTANKVLNESTYSFRELFDISLLLVNNSKTEDTKNIAHRVSEAIRYSDPVSNDELQPLEEEIKEKIIELSQLISKEDEFEVVKNKADGLLNLIEIRNNKCKTLKRQRI